MTENLARMVESGAASAEDLRPIVAAIRERAEIAADPEATPPGDGSETPEREA